MPRSLPFIVITLLLAPITFAADTAPRSGDALSTEVEQQLQQQTGVQGVTVTARGDHVILEGTVTSPFHRQRAIMAAEKVPGVALIESRLTVDTQQRSDAAIKADVEAALAQDQATRRQAIEVSVEDAVVTLAGTASSRADSRSAIERAEAVRGVRTVFDRMEINDPGRSDEAIASDLHVELAASAVIDDPIKVSVEDGRVRLSGTVDSAFERNWALRRTWNARGVSDVDATELQVLPNAPDASKRRSNLSDDAKAQAVRTTWSNEPLLREEEIEVRVSGNTATLTGQVSNLAAKQRAEQLAGFVAGVGTVQNELKVQAPSASDDQIQQQAQAALERSVIVEPQGIELAVNDGRITLSGTVQSPLEKELAESLVAQAEGALAVNNQLEVDVQPEYGTQPAE